jgi:hypothetical protein
VSDLFGNSEAATPRQLLTVFDTAYRVTNDGIPAPFVIKRDTNLAKNLLSRYSFDDLSRWSQIFFAHPDPFIKQSGYTFNVFVACLGKVIQYDRRLVAREIAKPAPLTDERRERLLALRRQIDRDDYGVQS